MAYDPEDDVTPGVTTPEQAEQQDAWDWREQQQTSPAPGGYTPPQRPLQGPAGTPVRTGLTRAAPPAVRAQPRASFADIDPDAQPLAVYGRPAPPPPEQGMLANTGDVMWKGVLSQAADIMGAARFAEQQLTSDPSTNTWIEQQRKSLEEQVSKEYADPKLQKIMTASLTSMFGGNTDAKGNHIPSPGEVGWFNYFFYNTMSMVPTVALALLPATTSAKIATKLMSSMGAVAKTAQAVGAGAGIAESAGQFGAQNLGALYNTVSGELMNTPEKEMMKSPAYAELRRGGYSDEESKAQLLKQTIPPMALQALVVGGLVGAGFTGMAARGALAPLASKGIKNLVLGAGAGATEMGGLMAGQAGADTALSQQAQQGMGLRDGYDTDAIRANAVAAGIGGAGMGALFGVAHPPQARAPSVHPNPDVPDDARSALETALNPEKPSGPPTFDPTTPGQMELPGMSPQGELFSGGETGGQAPRQPAITGVEPGMPPEAQQGGLFDPTTQVSQPPPVQGEMFPREPPPPNTPVEPPPAAPRGGAEAAPPESTPAAAPTAAPPVVDISAYAKMTRNDLIDALRSHGETVNPRATPDVMRKLLAQLDAERGASTPTPPDTTLATGVEPPTTGERSRPGEPVVAPPPDESSLPQTAAGVGPVTFKTAKGSTYQVHEDGTTTRDKAYRPEHGEAEQGPQTRSETTFYVSPEEADALGLIQARGGPGMILAPHANGTWGVKYTSGKDAGKFEQRTMVKPDTTPSVGKMPVEVWDNGKTVHFGNKITEVGGKAAETKTAGPTGHEILEGAGIAVGDTVTAPLKYRADGQPHKGAKPAIGEVVSVDGQHVTLKDASGKTWQARAEDLTKGEAVDPLAATEPGAAGKFTPEEKAASEARIAKMKADALEAAAKRKADAEAAAKQQSDLEAQTAATKNIEQAPEPEVAPVVKPKAAEEAVATSKAKEVEEPVATLVAKDTSRGRKKKPTVFIPEKGGPKAYVEGAEGGTREDLVAKPEVEEQQPVKEKTPEELRRERFAAEARAEAEGQAVANDANLERGGFAPEELHPRDVDAATTEAPTLRAREVSGTGESSSGTMRSQLGDTAEQSVPKGTSKVDEAAFHVKNLLENIHRDVGRVHHRPRPRDQGRH